MNATPDMTREEAEALLVFLANDTLEGPERAALESKISTDPTLARDLQALQGMRGTMQSQAIPGSPGALGLARLMRDIEAQDSSVAPGIQPPVPANQPWAPRLWKVAAAALLAVVVAQGFMLGRQSGPDLQLASGVSAPMEDGPSLRVGFVPSATEGQIREILLDLDLLIVDGPSSLGLYTLQAVDEAARLAAQEDLSNRPELVETVQ
ncbi:MAG: hypothetical protein AAGA28_17385 [Pseudomonadota bacterium]